MKAIIPAAGFATRLYPLTKNKPKTLLDVGRKKMLEHIIEKIEALGIIEEIIIVSNAVFFQQFLDWRKGFSCSTPITILNDGATSAETRLGSIGDYHFAIREKKICDDVLFVNSDNLFNFDLKPMFEHFCKKKCDVIALFDVGKLEEARKMGNPELDHEKRVVGFREKPEKPSSTLVSIGIYMYTRQTIDLFEQYLKEGNSPDKTGEFLEWLHKKKKVLGYSFSEPHHRWFDIGSHETLSQVRKEFS